MHSNPVTGFFATMCPTDGKKKKIRTGVIPMEAACSGCRTLNKRMGGRDTERRSSQ